MSPERKRTLRGMLALSALAIVWIGYALAIEARAIRQGGNSTISELVWSAWARQPGPIALGLVTAAFWAGVLCGHFFWQSADVYEADRVSDRKRAGLALLLAALLPAETSWGDDKTAHAAVGAWSAGRSSESSPGADVAPAPGPSVVGAGGRGLGQHPDAWTAQQAGPASTPVGPVVLLVRVDLPVLRVREVQPAPGLCPLVELGVAQMAEVHGREHAQPAEIRADARGHHVAPGAPDPRLAPCGLRLLAGAGLASPAPRESALTSRLSGVHELLAPGAALDDLVAPPSQALVGHTHSVGRVFATAEPLDVQDFVQRLALLDRRVQRVNRVVDQVRVRHHRALVRGLHRSLHACNIAQAPALVKAFP